MFEVIRQAIITPTPAAIESLMQIINTRRDNPPVLHPVSTPQDETDFLMAGSGNPVNSNRVLERLHNKKNVPWVLDFAGHVALLGLDDERFQKVHNRLTLITARTLGERACDQGQTRYRFGLWVQSNKAQELTGYPLLFANYSAAQTRT